jgi:hypothetical protein
LRLDRHVESCRRFVGDQDLWIAGERHGDHDPLAHSAGKLVWVSVEPPLGVRNFDEPKHLCCAGATARPRQALMQRNGFGHLPTDRHDRIERSHGFLKDHGDAITTERAHLPLRQLEQVGGAKEDLACRYTSGGTQETHDRKRRHALATPRLPNDAKGFSFVQIERKGVNRYRRSRAIAEMDN